MDALSKNPCSINLFLTLVMFCRLMKVDQKGSSRTCGRLFSRLDSSVGFQMNLCILTVSKTSSWCTRRIGTTQLSTRCFQAAGKTLFLPLFVRNPATTRGTNWQHQNTGDHSLGFFMKFKLVKYENPTILLLQSKLFLPHQLLRLQQIKHCSRGCV